MRKCTGNNTYEWGFDAVFEIECPNCGNMVEFFKDEITRNCGKCHATVENNSQDYGCSLWCSSSSSSEYARNICPKFKRSKERFYGRLL
jgi:ribosomal protein S27AE